VVRDSVDDLCVDDNGIKRDQIRDKQANFAPFIEHVENRLLPKWNLPCSKFHGERIFIWFFNDAVAEGIEYLDCTPDDLKDLVFLQELVVIRVHSCSLVVVPNPVVQLRGPGCKAGIQSNRSAQPTRPRQK
jgi:hypothetical protein